MPIEVALLPGSVLYLGRFPYRFEFPENSGDEWKSIGVPNFSEISGDFENWVKWKAPLFKIHVKPVTLRNAFRPSNHFIDIATALDHFIAFVFEAFVVGILFFFLITSKTPLSQMIKFKGEFRQSLTIRISN